MIENFAMCALVKSHLFLYLYAWILCKLTNYYVHLLIKVI